MKENIKGVRIIGYDENGKGHVLILDENEEKIMSYGMFNFETEDFEGEYVVDEAYVAGKLAELDWKMVEKKSKTKKIKTQNK